MTTGELIVVAIFGVGLLCSLSLLLWLRKLIRREGDPSGDASKVAQEIIKSDLGRTKNSD